MVHPLTAADRWRIRRTVRSFAGMINNLPGARRREIRRELHANLTASARDVGVDEAIRSLGSLRHLAAEYLDAEFGSAPRPSWVSGLRWALAMPYTLLVVYFTGIISFGAGLEAGEPAPGIYRWAPFGGWIGDYREVFDDGGYGGFTLDASRLLVTYVILAMLAYVVGGRLWRLLPAHRRRSS
jgi:hypothetical protein